MFFYFALQYAIKRFR